MVDVNLRELVKEYVVATIAAINVYIGMDKLPKYLRRVGEERERKRMESQMLVWEKGFEKMNEPLQRRIESLEKELQSYRAVGGAGK